MASRSYLVVDHYRAWRPSLGAKRQDLPSDLTGNLPSGVRDKPPARQRFRHTPTHNPHPLP